VNKTGMELKVYIRKIIMDYSSTGGRSRLYHYLFLLLILLGNTAAFAQTDDERAGGKNYIGVSFGGSDFHIKDDHASPMIYSGIGIAPSIQYFYRGGESRQYAEVSYYHGKLTTFEDNFHVTDNRGRARYAYVHSIIDFNLFDRKIVFFAGGSANSFLSHSDYRYSILGSTDGRTIESWQWSTSLDLSLQLEYASAGKEFVSAQFFMPIVSNISRPKYSLSGDYHYLENSWKFKMFGQTKLFTDSFSFDGILIYQRPLVGSFNLELSYEFYYSFYKQPQDIGMYMNNVRAGFLYFF